MNGFTAWLSQLRLDTLWQTALIVAASLLCITFHEVSHGYVAWRLGDPTAKRAGRLSLNPLRHIDLTGLLMMAIFRFGWAKPVPIDPRYFKNRKAGMALTALAGPLSNVLLSLLALIVMEILGVLYAKHPGNVLYILWLFFLYLSSMSAGLAVFNIFPIPPLDGSKVVFSFLPDRLYWKLMRYERYGMLLLAALLFFGVIDTPLGVLRDGLWNGLDAAACALVGLFT